MLSLVRSGGSLVVIAQWLECWVPAILLLISWLVGWWVGVDGWLVGFSSNNVVFFVLFYRLQVVVFCGEQADNILVQSLS